MIYIYVLSLLDYSFTTSFMPVVPCVEDLWMFKCYQLDTVSIWLLPQCYVSIPSKLVWYDRYDAHYISVSITKLLNLVLQRVIPNLRLVLSFPCLGHAVMVVLGFVRFLVYF